MFAILLGPFRLAGPSRAGHRAAARAIEGARLQICEFFQGEESALLQNFKLLAPVAASLRQQINTMKPMT